MKGTVYFNRSSGVRGAPEAEEIRKECESRDLELLEIAPRLDIFSSIRGRIAQGQRLFIAAGGDGTINHVIQPLVNTEAVLGVLPFGTFNHFAKDLGIPAGWRDALDIAISGEIRQIDTARVNDRFFLNNISLGLYPELVQRREKYRGHGRWRAYRSALRWTLSTYPHVSLVFESPPFFRAIRTHVFMVSVNAYDFSGFGLGASRKTLEGSELAVYWLPHMRRIRMIRPLAQYLRGRLSAVDGLHSMRTQHLKLQAARPALRLGMDGEVFEMRTPLTVTVAPRSLLVRGPRASP